METKQAESKKNNKNKSGCLVLIAFLVTLFSLAIMAEVDEARAENAFASDCQDYAVQTNNLNGQVIFSSSRSKPDMCRILTADGAVLEYTRQELTVLQEN